MEKVTWIDDSFISRSAGLALGDLDGDGRLDAAVANEYSDDPDKLWPGGVLLFLNEGDGDWTTITLGATTGTEYKSVALVDVNADGLADVIASYDEGTVLWMFDNSTAIAGSTAVMLSEDAYANAIVFGDIAGLGRVDLALVGENDELIEVLLQDADGEPSWTKYKIPGTNESTAFWAAALADIDGDGRLDLVAVTREDAMRITWWHNDPSILPSSWIPRDVFYDPKPDENKLFYAVDVGDLDGDGDVDIVSPIRTNDDIGDAYRNPSVVWFENPGDLVLEASAWNMRFVFDEESDDRVSPVDVVTSDVDGDGLIDVVVAGKSDRKVVVYFNDGVGSESHDVNFTAELVFEGEKGDDFTDLWEPLIIQVGVLDPTVSTLPSVVVTMYDVGAAGVWPLPMKATPSPTVVAPECVRVRDATLFARRVSFETCAIRSDTQMQAQTLHGAGTQSYVHL